MILVIRFPQVSDATFHDEEEQKAWMMKKVILDNKEWPPKEDDDNWRLSEFYYVHSMKKKTKTSFCVDENLSRAASDLASGSSMVALEDDKKLPKGKDSSAAHRQAVNKVVGVCARLAKAIQTSENALPSWGFDSRPATLIEGLTWLKV